MRFTGLLLLLLAGTASADGDTWIKKDNPNELYAFTFVDDCPFSDEVLQQETKGVLIRSRIRPAEGWYPRQTLLYVDATCFRNSNNVNLFDVDIFFAKFETNQDGDAVISHTVVNYGTIGQGDREFLLNAIEEGVERAITDYLVANFDLGDAD